MLQVVGQLTMGGQEIMAVNFFKYIDRKSIQFDFIVYGEEIGELEKQVTEMGGKVIHIPRLKDNGYLSFVKTLESVMIKNGPYTAVHSHTSLNSGLIMKVANKVSIPIRIVHSHTTRPGKKESVMFRLYTYKMRRLILKNANNLLACGNDAGNYLYSEQVFSEKGIVINNGIDLGKFDFNNEIRIKVRCEMEIQDRWVIGHVGRFGAEKNHEFLLKVFKKICEKDETALLLLIGDGQLMRTVKDQAKQLKIEENIIFAGKRNDISDLLQAMDVFVFPSIYEGLPVSLIEAQVAGLPCIISKNVTSEIKITSAVNFISLNDSEEEWGNLILKTKDIKRKGIKLIETEYDILESSKQLENIYKKGTSNESQ